MTYLQQHFSLPAVDVKVWLSGYAPQKVMALGWGLLSQFPPFRYFPNFSGSWKHTLPIKYHVCIWQMSPQLSCGDTCQIWMWFKEFNRYFCKIGNFACGEINERNFSNPSPWYVIAYRCPPEDKFACTPESTWDSFFQNASTLILAWIDNCIYYKMWDEITYPFPNCNHWSLGMDK